MSDWRTRIYNSYLTTSSRNRYYQTAVPSLQSSTHQNLQRYVRFLPADRNAEILDLGCGSGEFLYTLRTVGYTRLMGIDLSPQQVETARLLGVADIYLGDALSFLLARPATYQAITAFSILEHMKRDQLFALLDAIVSALKPGGRLLAVVPNAKGLFGAHVRYADITHEVSFTPQSICQICAVVGLEPTAIVEQGPLVHGPVSAARWAVWQMFRSVLFLARVAEGADWHWRVYTQDMLCVAQKP